MKQNFNGHKSSFEKLINTKFFWESFFFYNVLKAQGSLFFRNQHKLSIFCATTQNLRVILFIYTKKNVNLSLFCTRFPLRKFLRADFFFFFSYISSLTYQSAEFSLIFTIFSGNHWWGGNSTARICTWWSRKSGDISTTRWDLRFRFAWLPDVHLKYKNNNFAQSISIKNS